MAVTRASAAARRVLACSCRADGRWYVSDETSNRRHDGRPAVTQRLRQSVHKQKSLADYAAKRLRLAGGSYLDKHNPFFVPVDRARSDAAAKGERFTSFANYDYLGLSNHPAVKASAADALDMTGIGALASRLVGGERESHKVLEQALARFIGVEDVMTLVSGYLTNVTVISHIMGTRDVIFLDDLSHNSIISGCKASPAEVVFFRHNDFEHLDAVSPAPPRASTPPVIGSEGGW